MLSVLIKLVSVRGNALGYNFPGRQFGKIVLQENVFTTGNSICTSRNVSSGNSHRCVCVCKYTEVDCSVIYNNEKFETVPIPSDKELVKQIMIHFCDGIFCKQQR